ncbi:hypothetical protein SS1G_09060 [Sclerotinia sclerotiorum 1980 UF-70]|uniref:Peptidase S8/S53 domain-containing protein n=2 Tax=Sclerotinia sclerotiorum (strain ATCC 18683 / 1980 / Ss-1) TaxID=665079 RepID=A7EUQ2_SCLS1|nr:hypothetical protein SS1G_09060 [Sclerotinia sclerotiorum 1980 UF-70]APA15397.1 hypothetical protein sscle_14g101670 [Sclerotinia sclerotiorum 1980 UF-70]EDN93194.1 hypothetical protein SS1G_09060 [Sclerotinia sclerotiorum 1980 UF-70]
MLIKYPLLSFAVAVYGVTLPDSDLVGRSTNDTILYTNVNTVNRAFVVEFGKEISTSLSGRDRRNIFHKRAASISYNIRHEFDSTAFTGLSISVTQSGTDEELQLQLLEIPGVTGVWPVYEVPRPGTFSNLTNSENTSVDISSLGKRQTKGTTTGNLASALEMGGIDKLHAKGIKGKGIKIGIVDTGVDYRHPALGGGFGPGFKIAGGYSFVNDNGVLGNSPDPLSTCITGGHGTHVSGILGMDPISGDGYFPISGVAPEASLYMYRTFDCANAGGSDTIMAGMLKAQGDGVDIISMSLAIGTEWPSTPDPLASVVQSITQAGIAVIVAVGNDGSASQYSTELFAADYPAVDPSAIAVGAIANKFFPLVYPAVDSTNASLGYASVWPLNVTGPVHVYLLSDGCDSGTWTNALNTVNESGLLNSTIFAFEAFKTISYCNPNEIASAWSSSTVLPLYVMGFNSDIGNPYLLEYNVFSPSFFGAIQYINLNTDDGATLVNNYGLAGGFPSYTLIFTGDKYTSPPQHSGGLVDYYSNFGPNYFTYDLKPQISAPGGHILSTYPLGPTSNYAILSGTSMATPYVAGCFALLKSQFPSASISQILNLLQVTATPVNWVWDSTILSATAQQGAGLINAHDAIFAQSVISPGQIVLGDDSTHTVFGAANITIENTSGSSKTYTLSHVGAGYTDGQLSGQDSNQIALYGTGVFPTPTVTLASGESKTVDFSITPPTGVVASNRPVFGGFIKITSSAGETYTVPYIGPPYSMYNTSYISVIQVAGFDAAGLPEKDNGFLQINPTRQYGIAANIPQQYTLAFRFDLLPANTNITAHTNAFKTPQLFSYYSSKSTPKSSIFGHPSFGTYTNRSATIASGAIQPGNYIQYWTNAQVTGDDGVSYNVGDGDYRFFASVLRWGGQEGKIEDYDTWLGPVMRFNTSFAG